MTGRLTDRDKRILADLQRFRALSRDQIGAIHFARNKDRVTAVNIVMGRHRARGYVKAATGRSPYVYMPSDTTMRENSQKLDHYLAIADVYLALRQAGELREFDVEPRLGAKGTVEPDAFAIWRGWPWFIEVQRSPYSERTMQRKLARYAQFKREGKWRKLPWQPGNPKDAVWPRVWIIGERRYEGVADYVVQTRTIDELLASVR